MNPDTLTPEEFLTAARDFIKISDKLFDGWQIYENVKEIHKTYLKKDCFLNQEFKDEIILLKAEFVIFFNLSYGVPSFSFNIWHSSGTLIDLEEIQQMTFCQIKKKDFYSVITQQEHPLFFRPYFIVHPCHTAALLVNFRDKSKNIIVTFLSLITPLLKLSLPLEYGL